MNPPSKFLVGWMSLSLLANSIAPLAHAGDFDSYPIRSTLKAPEVEVREALGSERDPYVIDFYESVRLSLYPIMVNDKQLFSEYDARAFLQAADPKQVTSLPLVTENCGTSSLGRPVPACYNPANNRIYLHQSLYRRGLSELSVEALSQKLATIARVLAQKLRMSGAQIEALVGIFDSNKYIAGRSPVCISRISDLVCDYPRVAHGREKEFAVRCSLKYGARTADGEFSTWTMERLSERFDHAEVWMLTFMSVMSFVPPFTIFMAPGLYFVLDNESKVRPPLVKEQIKRTVDGLNSVLTELPICEGFTLPEKPRLDVSSD